MDIRVTMSVDTNNPTIGDLYLDNNRVRLTNSLLEEVSQRIYISLKLFKGEWFLDPDQGIPYWQSIIGTKTPLSTVGRIFRTAIEQQPGISDINSFNISYVSSTRAISISFSLTLVDGSILTATDFTPFIVSA